jgi:hypothetical protein
LVRAICGEAWGVTGTVEQLAETPAALAQAVFERVVTPAGRGLTTVTAKAAVRVLPAARLGSVNVQVELPTGEVHRQAGSLLAGSKVV